VSIRSAISLNGHPLADADIVADNFAEWQPVDIACRPQPNVVAARLLVGGTDLGPPTAAFGDPVWRWRWLPRDAVGVFDARLVLTLNDGAANEAAFRIRIRPRTIDSEHYEALIEAVQRDAAALVYALHGGTEGASLGSGRARSLLEDYAVLVEQLGPAAVRITQEIAAQPHHTLRSERSMMPLAEVDRFDPATLAALAHTPPDVTSHVHTAEYTGVLPYMIQAQRAQTSPDVVEHRLLKGVLQTLLWRVGSVQSVLGRERERRAHHDSVHRKLRQAIDAPFLHGVKPISTLGEPTQLMRRAPRYRRMYELYRALRNTPWIDWDSPTLWLPIQSLPLLYEQWCTLQVLTLLMELGTITEQHLLAHDENADVRRWTLRLRQQGPLLAIKRDDGVRVRVFYQRRYAPHKGVSAALGSLDPFVRVPDIAIEVERDDQPTEVLLLDAKYRVTPDGGVPQDALDDAYAYRNAIGSANKRRTLGAFLLYPGTKQIAGADNVGALPALPMNDEQLAMIKEILSSQ
jgi:large subunit ribosomal protein MRP49